MEYRGGSLRLKGSGRLLRNDTIKPILHTERLIGQTTMRRKRPFKGGQTGKKRVLESVLPRCRRTIRLQKILTRDPIARLRAIKSGQG